VPAAVLFLTCACSLLLVPGFDTRHGKEGDSTSQRQEAGSGEKKAAGAGKPFRLPDDDAGALLGKVLPPRQVSGPLRNLRREVRRAPPAKEFPAPGLPLPGSDGALPRLPAPPSTHVLKPHLLEPEEFGEAPTHPTPPQRPTFAAGVRVRTPSRDVNVPAPLPLLASPLSDRAPLDDTTAQASAAAALAALLPWRTTPAPYERVRVPDPLKNHRRLLVPVPAEKATPVTATPVPPKP
jgi:hypothetical protein